MEKNLYVIDTRFDSGLLIKRLSEFLQDKYFPENYTDLERSMYCLLEKPCLTYTFESISDYFITYDISFGDLVYDFEDMYEDFEDFTKKYVKRLDGSQGLVKQSLLDWDIVLELTEAELRSFIENVWTFILNKSINTPENPLCDKYKIWWKEDISSELKNLVSLFAENNVKLIQELVENTLKNNIHIINTKIINLPEKFKNFNNISEIALSELEYLNTFMEEKEQ